MEMSNFACIIQTHFPLTRRRENTFTSSAGQRSGLCQSVRFLMMCNGFGVWKATCVCVCAKAYARTEYVLDVSGKTPHLPRELNSRREGARYLSAYKLIRNVCTRAY